MLIKEKFGNKKPSICFVAGTHGDELVGIEVLKLISDYLKGKKINGSVSLIIANPEAVNKTKRFLDEDLNRVFHLEFNGKLNHERKIALNLAEFFSDKDFVFDIHSLNKPGKSFVYIFDKKNQIELADIFKTDFIVSGENYFKDISKPYSIDRYVARLGSIGLTIETGFKKDFKNLKSIFESCLNTLRFLGVLDDKDYQINESLKKTVFLEIYEEVKSKTGNFKFSKDYKNFDFLSKGEVLGHGEKELKAKEDSFIIFPKDKIDKNGRVCLLSRESRI